MATGLSPLVPRSGLADRRDVAILDRKVGADWVVPEPIHDGGAAEIV